MGERQFLKGNLWGLFGFFCVFFAISAKAGVVEHLYDGRNLQETSIDRVLASVKPGTVIVLGEQHAHLEHQNEQIQVIETLQKSGLLTSVGMEFFTYTNQADVEAWRQGRLGEADFLTKIGWGQGFSFDYYRTQVQLPRLGHEAVVALNAPRALTGKVAKTGLGSLLPEEAAFLPPHFELGNARYFERFKDAMGGHFPSPDAAKNYFTAQSIWDDTMAWQAAEFLKAHPEQILVIIVGEFHVQYGGGLPDRLAARGLKNVVTISLVNIDGLSPDEEHQALAPSSVDGPRAHFVWASKPL